jgi:hypothetical protein
MVGGDALTRLQGRFGVEADVRAGAWRDAKIGLDDRRTLADWNLLQPCGRSRRHPAELRLRLRGDCA